MMHTILKSMDALFQFQTVSAHCDVPCGIYDPSTAQIASLTVIRMLDLIQELADKGDLNLSDQARLSRLVSQKEIHADKVKEEIRIIWGDYFKEAQFNQVPGIHALTHKIMMQASKCRQSIDQENGIELLILVNQFAERFWATKEVKTKESICPYPPSQPVIYPVLNS
ncbi:MAG: superoxide dismutase, Ni [Methylophaga sp.]|nr:MAG: superoxide dismutase, Ni [Methylophaga sp.]